MFFDYLTFIISEFDCLKGKKKYFFWREPPFGPFKNLKKKFKVTLHDLLYPNIFFVESIKTIKNKKK